MGVQPRTCTLVGGEQSERREVERQTCPLCGGWFHPQSGAWRCGRCGFALCQGCEGGEPVALPVEAD